MRRSINTITMAFVAAIVSLATVPAKTDEIQVAIASNFTEPIKEIAERFEQQSGHEVTLAFGSTGKHYAQIKNGAPFEAFFAADVKRPKLLEEKGLAQPGSRFTYAFGKVVLWSPNAGTVDTAGKVLEQGDFRYLALANPELAPYGKAAREVLEKRDRWQALQGRIVRGENIGQTFQFVISGNAELGFVAFSQIKRPGRPLTGSWWEIPQALYSPIEQQAVLLKDNAATRDFLTFVRAEEARKIIQVYGYGTP